MPEDEAAAQSERGQGVRVLVVDDHPVFRDGLRALLDAAPGVEWIGEARDGEEALAAVARLDPDVVLMDLRMPGAGGLDATQRIARAHPRAAVVVLTMVEDDDAVFAAVRAGARGYLLKGADRAEIVRAVSAAAAGEALFGAGIAARLVDYFGALRSADRARFPELTEREREVLVMMAQGRSNGEIAARLILSDKTVRNHVSNVLAKLQVADRAQAIVKARRAGLTGPDGGAIEG